MICQVATLCNLVKIIYVTNIVLYTKNMLQFLATLPQYAKIHMLFAIALGTEALDMW